MKISSTIYGSKDLMRKLATMPVEARGAVYVVLQRAALDLKGKAQRITPVESGDLQGSAYAEAELTAEGVEAVVGFDSVYARRQHEELDWQHKAPGQAKFLEQPYEENRRKYSLAVTNAIKKAVEK